MTDRYTDHRAAAEGLLADADDWGWQAGESSPEASELSCLAYGTLHALLAIHDTLADLKPEPVTYPWPMTGLTHKRGTQWVAASAGTHDRAERREEAEPDPLDEDDHRDRIDRDGTRLIRVGPHHWHPPSGALCGLGCNGLSLANWNSSYGPLAFAPDAAQETPRVDPSASQDESGAVEGGGAPMPSTRLSPACVKRWPDCAPSEYNPSCCRFPKSCSPLDTDGAQEPLVCPECDHHINVHDVDGCLLTRCDCPRTPEDVALALIARAVSVDIEDAR